MSFSVAVNERRKGESGEWEDHPSFVDCTVFGRRAESLARHMTRGRMVLVSGRLHQSTWTDADGNARSRLEVNVDEVAWDHRAAAEQPRDAADGMPVGTYDDEIPF